jgi:hypothetical protein
LQYNTSLAPIGIVDPFDQYPHFPAALHAPGLPEELEIVEVSWVVVRGGMVA